MQRVSVQTNIVHMHILWLLEYTNCGRYFSMREIHFSNKPIQTDRAPDQRRATYNHTENKMKNKTLYSSYETNERRARDLKSANIISNGKGNDRN